MGLYLCIFDGDDELDGVEVGSYADFSALRHYVSNELEGGATGTLFPTFILHSDCDGEWSAVDCETLVQELGEIARRMKGKSPVPFASEWQQKVAKSIGHRPANAYESFIDVDGELLVERLHGLALLAIRRQRPILFQ